MEVVSFRMDITGGKWEAKAFIDGHGGWIEVWSGEKLISYYETNFTEYPSDGENEANANLMAEAGTITNETGLTPTDLRNQRFHLAV